MKRINIITKLIFFLIPTFFCDCKSQQDNIPYVYVNITIDLNKPEFNDLNGIGNFVYVTGGVSGIVVYRNGLTDFYAYERACPYDPQCGRVSVDSTGIYLVDDVCCSSKFSLTMRGACLEGPATLPLRQYATYYNQNTNTLQIVNQ